MGDKVCFSYSVTVGVPLKSTSDFKNAVLSHWFESDEPHFTHHSGASSYYEYDHCDFYTFEADTQNDIDYVIGVIPDGGFVVDKKGRSIPTRYIGH